MLLPTARTEINAIYDQVLNQLKGFMRGLIFDEKILLSDLRAIDNIISYNSLPMSSKFIKKYNKAYLQ